MNCIYPLLLLFSSRCTAAGISGHSLAADFFWQRSDAMVARETGQNTNQKNTKKWESLRACISLACVQGSHNAETEMRLLEGHQVSENKDVSASNAGNWGSLGSVRVFPSILLWKRAPPVSRPAKRITARSRGGKERQTDIETLSDSI